MQQIPTINKILMYMFPIMASLSGFVMGYFLVYFSLLDDYIRSINIFVSDQSFDIYFTIATASLPLGAFVGKQYNKLGSFLYSKIIIIFGQNKTMVYADCLAILSMIMQIITMSTPVLFISRFLMGIYCSITMGIVPTFCLSLSPKHISGISGTINQIAIVSGMAFAYMMGSILDSKDLSGKIAVGIYCGIPLINNIIHIICLKLLPFDNIETTIYRRDAQQFMKYMKIMYGKEWRKFQKQVRRNKQIPIQTQPNTQDQFRQQQRINNQNKPQKTFSQKLKQKIMGCKLQRGKVLSIIMTIGSQLTGFYAILQYSKQIFQTLQQDEDKAQNSVLLLGIFQVIVNIIGGLLIHKYGRRIMMLTGTTIVSISLILCSISSGIFGHNIFTVICIFIYILGYGFSFGPLCIMYSIQILIQLKNVLIIYWGLMLVVTVWTDMLVQQTSGTLMFVIFSFVSVLCTVFFYYRMIETKSLSKKQIKQLIQQQTFKWQKTIQIEQQNKQDKIQQKLQKLQVEGVKI